MNQKENQKAASSNLHHCQYGELKINVANIYGLSGEKWISDLPRIVDKLRIFWDLHHLQPVNNMSFHFVAKARTKDNIPVVLKIGNDKKVTENEMHALKSFSGHASIKLLDFHPKHSALLLEQAVPGHSLKSIYPSQSEYVMDEYIKTANKLHQKKIFPCNFFPTVEEWLSVIDECTANHLPTGLMNKAIELKKNLLSHHNHVTLLHGDLHQDNVLNNADEWLVIDPKGVIGQPEFELAAFDFIPVSEFNDSDLANLFLHRIQLFAKKSGVDFQRLKNWVYVRLILSALWSIEDKTDPSRAISLAHLLENG